MRKNTRGKNERKNRKEGRTENERMKRREPVMFLNPLTTMTLEGPTHEDCFILKSQVLDKIDLETSGIGTTSTEKPSSIRI